MGDTALQHLSAVALAHYSIIEEPMPHSPYKATTITSIDTRDFKDKPQHMFQPNSLIPIPMPPLLRSKSQEGTYTPASIVSSQRDWDKLVSEKERNKTKKIIKESYLNHFNKNNIEDLIDICVSIEEEILFSSVPSRIDYYKQGRSHIKRIEDYQYDRNQSAAECSSEEHI